MLTLGIDTYGEFEETRQSVYVKWGHAIFLNAYFVAIIQHCCWFLLCLFVTVAVTERDAFTRFQVRAARGEVKTALDVLHSKAED
jgi:hypothetical protein